MSNANAHAAHQVLSNRELRCRQPLARTRADVCAGKHRTHQLAQLRASRLPGGVRGEALGARYALDAAMRATDNQLIAVNATGCLEVFFDAYPETSWQIPWLHSLFGNAPAVATGGSPRR